MRLRGPIRKYPLTGGAGAHDAKPDGADDTLRGEVLKRSEAKNIEVNEAGRAKELGRIQSILSLRYLKLMVSEEICGRFGSFDGQTLHINASRLRPMMKCQLHCFAAFGAFGTWSTRQKDCPDLAGRDDVRGFERQG